MKLAYMMATPEVKSMPLCWVGDVDRIVPRIAEIGYRGVELQVRDPAAFDRKRIARLAQDAGIAITAVSTGQVGAEDGLYLTDPKPEVRAAAIQRFKEVLRLAADYGVDASIGRFRGLLKWAPDRATGLEWFRSAMDQVLPDAERLGVRIVLEPQMRFNTDFLNTFDETIRFIESVGSTALAFEGDLFHMAMEEKSLPAAIVAGQRSGRMTYFQLGDSNRLAPGWGHLNWVDIVETLRASGYDGWLAMEFTQQPDSDTCAQQAFRFTSGLLATGT